MCYGGRRLDRRATVKIVLAGEAVLVWNLDCSWIWSGEWIWQRWCRALLRNLLRSWGLWFADYEWGVQKRPLDVLEDFVFPGLGCLVGDEVWDKFLESVELVLGGLEFILERIGNKVGVTHFGSEDIKSFRTDLDFIKEFWTLTLWRKSSQIKVARFPGVVLL